MASGYVQSPLPGLKITCIIHYINSQQSQKNTHGHATLRETRCFLFDRRRALIRRWSCGSKTAENRFSLQQGNSTSTRPQYIHKHTDSEMTRLRYLRIVQCSLLDYCRQKRRIAGQASNASGASNDYAEHHLAGATLTEQMTRRSLE